MSLQTAPPVETGGKKRTAKRTTLESLSQASIFESFYFRDFRWVWLGMFGSFMGFNMLMITRGWLVLRLADDSPLALALVIMSFAAPMTVVSLIGGALADRISRKRMVLLSEGGNALMALLLATLDLTNVVDFWHVLVIGLVSGSMMASNMPSRQAMISEIVPEGKLMNAIALNSSSMNLTRIAGPALAGMLIVFMDTAGVFFLISGIYCVSMLSMTMVGAGSKPVAKSGKGITGDIREGFAYAGKNSALLSLIIMLFIPGLFGYSYFVLLPAWGREALDVDSDGLGFLVMMMGVGALVGTLSLAALGRLRHKGLFLLVSALAWGVALSIFSQTTSYAAAIPILMLMGLVSSIFMSLTMTLMQLHSAPEMRGRIMSIGMTTFGVMPLSAVPLGAVAEGIGTPDALLISGVLLVAFTLVFAAASPSMRKLA
jgi:MFS family permease